MLHDNYMIINLQKLTQISEKSLHTPLMADATFSYHFQYNNCQILLQQVRIYHCKVLLQAVNLKEYLLHVYRVTLIFHTTTRDMIQCSKQDLTKG